MEEIQKSTPVEPPLEIYPGRIDEKGRLKLPADIQRYLSDFFQADGGPAKVFVTSLDVRTIRVYPTSVWKQNELLLAEETENPDEAEDLVFLAKDLGGTSEIDSQGRILVPAELRRELKVENEPVWMNCYNSRIDVFGKDVYEERRTRSRENLKDRVRHFARKGLK